MFQLGNSTYMLLVDHVLQYLIAWRVQYLSSWKMYFETFSNGILLFHQGMRSRSDMTVDHRPGTIYKDCFPQVSTNFWWQVWPKRLSNFLEHSFSMPQCTPSCFHPNRFHACVAAENLSTQHLKHIVCDSQWEGIFYSYEIFPYITL